MAEVLATMADNWVYWAVSIFAIIAAYIDGKELRVPNKLTFPMIIAGWIWSSIYYGMEGDGWYLGHTQQAQNQPSSSKETRLRIKITVSGDPPW